MPGLPPGRVVRLDGARGARVTRQWEKQTATPAQRVLGHGAATMETRKRVGQALADHDPVTMKRNIEAQLREVHRQIEAGSPKGADPPRDAA